MKLGIWLVTGTLPRKSSLTSRFFGLPCPGGDFPHSTCCSSGNDVVCVGGSCKTAACTRDGHGFTQLYIPIF